MSSEKIPILLGAIPSFELFMSTWEKLIVDNLCLKPLIYPGLNWAPGYYSQMDCTCAYVINMSEVIPQSK